MAASRCGSGASSSIPTRPLPISAGRSRSSCERRRARRARSLTAARDRSSSMLPRGSTRMRGPRASTGSHWTGICARACSITSTSATRIRAHLAGERQDRNLVAACAAVAATDGDALLHGRYLARVRETAGREPQEEERFREALPVFRDEAATAATIAAIDDGTIRDQDLPGIFFEGLRNVAAREAYWRALRERYAPRIAPLEGLRRNAVVSSTGPPSPPP